MLGAIIRAPHSECNRRSNRPANSSCAIFQPITDLSIKRVAANCQAEATWSASADRPRSFLMLAVR